MEAAKIDVGVKNFPDSPVPIEETAHMHLDQLIHFLYLKGGMEMTKRFF